jgi:hypothetical protein
MSYRNRNADKFVSSQRVLPQGNDHAFEWFVEESETTQGNAAAVIRESEQ